MELLTASTLLSLHGFPTRAGGVSAAPFDSLNSSLVVGDDASHVHENLRRLAHRAHVSPGRLATVTQVHGEVVVSAADSNEQTRADALWTSEPGRAVGIRTADCVPVLIEDRRTGSVAAVHAGWRGVIGEIVTHTVVRLEAAGSQRGDLFFAIGPCIQRCCFEVDGDVPERFRAAFSDQVIVAQAGKVKVHLDLPLAVQHSLAGLGIEPGHVAKLPQCTRCDVRFFSHRREHGRTGRHLSFITCGIAADL